MKISYTQFKALLVALDDAIEAEKADDDVNVSTIAFHEHLYGELAALDVEFITKKRREAVIEIEEKD